MRPRVRGTWEHTRIRHVLVLLCCCLLVPAAVAAPAAADGPGASSPTSTEGPSVSVTIDGKTAADGGTVLIDDETANVRIDAVTENTTLDAATLRIDGVAFRAWTLENDTASLRASPELSYGRHTLEIVVTDGDGALSTRTVTLVVDDRPPAIGFSAPFETGFGDFTPNPVVTRSNLTVAGQVFELSRTDELTVTVGSRDYPVVSTYSTDDPGDSFNWSTYLAPGPNRVTVYAEDRFGQSSKRTFTVTVSDEGRPDGRIDDLDPTTNGSVRVTGSVSDDVFVRSARLVAAGETYEILPPKRPGKAAVAERRHHEFSVPVAVPEGDTPLLLVVEDYAGNEHVETVSVRREPAPPAPASEPALDPDRPPEIDIEESGVRVVDGDTVRVTGRAVGTNLSFVDLLSRIPNGGAIDYRIVTAGDRPNAVQFSRTVDVRADGVTEVTLSTRDADGDAASARFWVTGDGEISFEEPPGNATATVSPTPTGSEDAMRPLGSEPMRAMTAPQTAATVRR